MKIVPTEPCFRRDSADTLKGTAARSEVGYRGKRTSRTWFANAWLFQRHNLRVCPHSSKTLIPAIPAIPGTPYSILG